MMSYHIPKVPEHIWTKTQNSKNMITFSSSMIVYDDRLWWPCMIIIWGYNLGHEGLGHIQWGHEGRAYNMGAWAAGLLCLHDSLLCLHDSLLCIKGKPIMPPRQPMMPKRTAYYACEIKKLKNAKRGIDGFQMGLFSDLIRSKCHSDHFPTFWKNMFFRRKIDRWRL